MITKITGAAVGANAQRSNMASTPPDGGGELEQSLFSLEKLDRASPDLWPEQIPGVAEFVAIHSPPNNNNNNAKPKWLQDLKPEDINTLHSFGSLTTANLMEKVRGLQNLAYQLGLEEAHEMTRGKFLNILEVNFRKR